MNKIVKVFKETAIEMAKVIAPTIVVVGGICFMSYMRMPFAAMFVGLFFVYAVMFWANWNNEN